GTVTDQCRAAPTRCRGRLVTAQRRTAYVVGARFEVEALELEDDVPFEVDAGPAGGVVRLDPHVAEQRLRGGAGEVDAAAHRAGDVVRDPRGGRAGAAAGETGAIRDRDAAAEVGSVLHDRRSRPQHDLAILHGEDA